MNADGADAESLSPRAKLAALYALGTHRPLLTLGAIGLSIFAALLEGIGLSFLVPIIELAREPTSVDNLSRVGSIFVSIYDSLGVPFSLGTILLGVSLVMTVRYVSSFLVTWVRTSIRVDYQRHLQTEGFKHALEARVAYYDTHGSDEVLNAIVTQAEYAARLVQRVIKLIEQIAIAGMYFAIAVYLSPFLTVVSISVLGIIMFLLRFMLESGYTVGDRVAEANERVQESVQAGIQGIREVKLFGIAQELFEGFQSAIDQYAASEVGLQRNEAILNNMYQWLAALTVFLLIYLALTFADLSLASLGAFLFAMFRLAPQASRLNSSVYKINGNLPHLVRMHRLLDDLSVAAEVNHGDEQPPNLVDTVTFENVSFAYDERPVLSSVTFSVDVGDFVAFVGPSGAGKSTIVSLLARLYDPDDGRITANETPIQRFELSAWRDTIAVVRQHPHVFNDTLRYNLTVGNREATEEEIHAVCDIAQVSEFLEQLDAGLDTVIGEDGVRLSGGQRQRVAIARALLKPADILLLDEATSNLDTHLERRIHEGIEQMTDFAMIVVAHRLSTVTGADRIYTMEQGEITEKGTHDELLTQGGTYADLYARQS